MGSPFIYGMSVDGEHFTDREWETKRLALNFTNGVNSILISPRRMGKTSLVKKVAGMVNSDDLKVVYVDIYNCRTAYEFYEKFASAVIRATATKVEKMIETAKKFLMGVVPQINYSPEPNTDFSLSVGITPNANPPEEILNLPERIATERGIRIVVCVDEFQQIGEMPDALTVQKTIRSVWQHHRRTSYCLFGSKQHLMSQLFYSRKMPFYQFGDMFFLKKIPTDKWVPFIVERFKQSGKVISSTLAERICQAVDNYSAYVQQLAWNVLVVCGEEVTPQDIEEGLGATLDQVAPLFIEQTANLSTYQLNFIRAICRGYHDGYGRSEVASQFSLGSMSNISKLKKALVDREIVEITESGCHLADPLFKLWFIREMM